MLGLVSEVGHYVSDLGTAALPTTPLGLTSTIFIAAALIPTLYFLLFTESSKLPPRYSLLAPLFKGEFDLKNEGPLAVIRAAHKQCGDVFRLRLFHQPVSVLIGPAAHQVFFDAKDSQLSQKECYTFTIPVFGKGIVYDAPPKVMMQQLKFVNRGLNHNNMTAHVGKIVREAEEYFATWGDSGEIDLMHELSRLIINTASRCLLGDEIREGVHEEFARYYQELSDGMSHLSFFFPHAPTKAHKKRDKARKQISALFSRVIRQRRQEPNQGSGLHDDYLQVLIDARYTDGRQVEDEEIVGLLLAALFAGQHTSNITSTWMGFLFMNNKQWMKRVLEEQKQVMDKHDNKVTFESLAEMQILHNCMKETLRLFPPLIILMRKALEPLTVNGKLIPKGDIVCVCPPVSHRLESVYTNPESFDPDRFSAERAEDAKQRFSFIAFGGGRHGCLGERFAFLQVKTIWSLMSRMFDFEMVQEQPKCDYSALVVGPQLPCRMRFKRKKDPYAFNA